MYQKLSVNIPVLPHIKKHLTISRYLKAEYDLTLKDNLGVFIERFLEPPPKYYKPITETSLYYIGRKGGKKKAEMITINLGRLSDRGKYHISQKGIHLFNVWCDDIFYNEMYTYIEARLMEKRQNIQTLIHDFLDKYTICEDELSIRSVLRWYYRNRKKRESLENNH